jgi:hypothetical protein
MMLEIQVLAWDRHKNVVDACHYSLSLTLHYTTLTE